MSATLIKKISRVIVLPALAFLVFAGSYFHLLDIFELHTLDVRFRMRPKIPATDKIAIIEIGDDSLKKLGAFPIDRSYHAILTKALSESGAKAIVFDIFFSEPQEHDREFEEAIREAGNVYLPFVFEIDRNSKGKFTQARGYGAQELEYFSILAKGTGHINVIPDIDGKFRRVPPYIKYGSAFYPYLSLRVACDWLGIPEKDIEIMPGEYLKCGKDITIPLDGNSNMIVNFSGAWGRSYKHYSFVDILQSYFAKQAKARPILNLDEFRGKVCLVGLTAVGTIDLHPNPFESLYPAVGMHAEVFNSILNKRFIQRLPPYIDVLVLALVCLIMLPLTLKTRPMTGFALLAGFIILFAVICVVSFDLYGLWIDMVYPLFIAVILYVSVTLYKYVTEWKKRLMLERELDIAKKIQESFLPKALPHIDGMDIAAVMFTARQVGGDLYDFVEFQDGRIGIMIGDVSGKGVPASLFMAMVTGAFKTFALPESRPEEVLSSLNRKLMRESSSNLFVTVFYSIFNPRDKIMVYGNGGHLPVLRMAQEGEPEFLDVKEGPPLGLMESPYSSGQIKVGKDDVLVFYTDGLTEATNAKSEMYEKERLAAVVKENRRLSSKAILAVIEKDVRKFEPKTKQHDDITIIVVKIF